MSLDDDVVSVTVTLRQTKKSRRQKAMRGLAKPLTTQGRGSGGGDEESRFDISFRLCPLTSSSSSPSPSRLSSFTLHHRTYNYYTTACLYTVHTNTYTLIIHHTRIRTTDDSSTSAESRLQGHRQCSQTLHILHPRRTTTLHHTRTVKAHSDKDRRSKERTVHSRRQSIKSGALARLQQR